MQTDRRRSVLLLSVAAVVLALVGAGLIGAYGVLSKRLDADVAAPPGPIREWTPAEAIDAQLALLTLAGWTDQAAIDQSLAEGEPDTALSILAYSVTLRDRARAGLLLRLASIYSAQARPDLSRGLYDRVGMVAILSPELSDLTRTELLIQSASGLITLRQTEDAVTLLDQAAVIVQESTELKPAQRQQLVKSVGAAYNAAGVEKNENAEALKRLDGTSAQPKLGAKSVIPLGAFISVDGESIPSDSLDNVVIARKEAASELIQALASGAGEWPVAQVAGLADVLRAEDDVVAKLAQDAGLSAIMRAETMTGWLTTKSYVARGRLGFNPIPEWESAADEVDEDLGAAWDWLFESRREVVLSAVSSDWEEALLGVDLVRAEVLAGELGLIPGYDRTAGADRLLQALAHAQSMGVDSGWMLDISIDENVPQFTIRVP